MASYANDHRGCYDTATGMMAYPNAKLVVVNRKHPNDPTKILRYAYLKCIETIPAGTEIKWNYGKKYEFPPAHYPTFVDLTNE